jgi:protein gp37/ParB-like chromosome segregation protein Spo0J
MEGEEFADLIADIKRNGLREPILVSNDGQILLDGRNRYRACDAAGVDAVHELLPAHYSEAMTLDLIVSRNIARRHLNPGQVAVLALDYEAAYVGATREAEVQRKIQQSGQVQTCDTTGADLPRAPRSTDRAARAVGAAGRTVRQAKAVQKNAPDLIDRVRSGELALDAADKLRKQRVKIEPKPEQEQAGSSVLTLFTHEGVPVSYPQPKSPATFNPTTGEGISWARWSWNPVTGCLHGCEYCYARELATRDSYRASYPVGFTPLFHAERLDAPVNTRIPAKHEDDPAWRRVFVCSMADLYGRWVPDEWIKQVHDAMQADSRWQYILLTKFPTRYIGLNLPRGAWVGTSVDEQKRVRIAEDAFRQIDSADVKWLSLEPLRAPLEFTDLSMFDWVVIGAQTETRQPSGTVPAFAPPFEWVARLVAQAREAGCRIHLKPNLKGATSPQLPGMAFPDEYPEGAGSERTSARP